MYNRIEMAAGNAVTGLEEPGYIKDRDCTKDTPVILGKPDTPVYGQGVRIRPRIAGRKDSKHFEEIYLPELLPLEEYDKVIVLFSGGKDSMACFLKLLELGIPKEKIELWHHDIDGGHPERQMDWKCTSEYVSSVAKAFGVTLRVSYRVNGFFGELYRIGASEPVEWLDPETGAIKQCRLSPAQVKSREIKEQAAEEAEELLKEYGYRMKFPAKSPDLSRRWCSAYLKIAVADSVMSNIDRLGELGDGPVKKVLVVSGERRGESAGRSKYNEMEIHRTNAEAKSKRTVHQWRCCIDYSERDVWEVLKRHRVNPHPCYRLGWNRCSCAMCIFSTPRLYKGFSELFPEEFAKLHQDEERLGFTLDNKKDLLSFIEGAESCLNTMDTAALNSVKTGTFPVEEVFVEDWKYPVGAFHGADGGSC